VAAAYQGQAGAYSEQAARRLCGPDAALLPCETLADVFSAIDSGLALTGQVIRPEAAPRADDEAHVMIGARLAHEPGRLANLLHALAASGLNLTRIDSAPIHGSPFEYEFLLEGIAPAGRRLDGSRIAGECRVISTLAASRRGLLTSSRQALHRHRKNRHGRAPRRLRTTR
jgi:prephenate dehydratase